MNLHKLSSQRIHTFDLYCKFGNLLFLYEVLKPMVLKKTTLNSIKYTWVRHTNRGWHLSPLQHHILGDSTVGVDIDALVLVT